MARENLLPEIPQGGEFSTGTTGEFCTSSDSNHTCRGTGITEFLRNGGNLETAARIAGHESTRTTQLYDRTDQQLSLDEIERILI